MRGKKTAPEDIYKVMTAWAIHKNNMEVSRTLGIPEATVRKIVEENKDKEEFKKLCDEKKETFAKGCDEIIELAVKRMKGMLEDEEEHIPINHLAIVFGTAYDKRALAKGETTQNIDFATNPETIGKLLEIAGYSKVKKDE